MRTRPWLASVLLTVMVGAAWSCGGDDDDDGGGSSGAGGTGSSGAGGSGGAAAGAGGSGGTAGTGGSAGSAGAAGSGGSAGTAGTGGSANTGDWQSAYAEGGVGINCAQSEADMQSAGAPSLTFGNTTIYVGFEQDGQNQNPVFARFDDGTKVYCEHHETEGPDGRALGITWDGGGVAYVVYTIVGGGSSLEGKGGWVPSYAPGAISGGGPKVSYVGQVETTYGTLSSGTFVIAVKSDNKVNSHGPRAAVTVLDDGNVEFLGASAHKPIDEGWVAMDCTDYPFDSRYRFSPDLGSLVCADCTNCTSKKPCP